MSTPADKLEHLFSRVIDAEATPDERELLRSVLDADADTRELFEQYRELDAHIGRALRQSVHTTPALRPRLGVWHRIGRPLAVAAAACLATFFWLQPRVANQPPTDGSGPAQAAATNLFAPWQQSVDVVEPVPSAFERPEVELRGTEKDWIVVPADQPGQFMIIEVRRVRTHTVAVQQDF